MAWATRSSLLKPRPPVPVEAPELGGTVGVRTLTGTELVAFLAESKAIGMDDYPAQHAHALKWATESLVDEGGFPLLDSAEALDAYGRALVDRLFGVVLRVNGLTEEAEEEIAAGFPTTPTGSGGSA